MSFLKVLDISVLQKWNSRDMKILQGDSGHIRIDMYSYCLLKKIECAENSRRILWRKGLR